MRSPLPLLVGLLLSCGPAEPEEPVPACPPGGTDATWANHGQAFLEVWCTGCHHSALPLEERQGAPEGVDFDTYAGTRTWAAEIHRRTVAERTMPPVGGPSEEGRELLGEWLACGLPGGRPKGVEPCQGERSVRPGDLVVAGPADLDTFCAEYDAVGGDLVLQAGGILELDCLCAVDGSLVIDGASGLTSATFPNLLSVGGALRVEGNPILGELDVSEVESVGAEVVVAGNPSLEELWLSRLFTAGGSLEVRDNAGMVSVGLERVLTVGGDLVLADNPSWRTLFGDAYALQAIGGDLRLSGNPELDGFYGFVELLEVGGDVLLADNDSFESFFGFTALESVGGSVVVRDHARLGLVDGFDHLRGLPGGLEVSNNAVMLYIDGFRVLDAVGGDGVILAGLPGLQGVGGLDDLRQLASLTIHQTGLTTLSELYGIAAIDGDLTVTDNPSLPAIQVDNLVTAVGAQNIGGYVTNSGNAP